jgi:hypothetical protein
MLEVVGRLVCPLANLSHDYSLCAFFHADATKSRMSLPPLAAKLHTELCGYGARCNRGYRCARAHRPEEIRRVYVSADRTIVQPPPNPSLSAFRHKTEISQITTILAATATKHPIPPLTDQKADLLHDNTYDESNDNHTTIDMAVKIPTAAAAAGGGAGACAQGGATPLPGKAARRRARRKQLEGSAEATPLSVDTLHKVGDPHPPLVGPIAGETGLVPLRRPLSVSNGFRPVIVDVLSGSDAVSGPKQHPLHAVDGKALDQMGSRPLSGGGGGGPIVDASNRVAFWSQGAATDGTSEPNEVTVGHEMDIVDFGWEMGPESKHVGDEGAGKVAPDTGGCGPDDGAIVYLTNDLGVRVAVVRSLLSACARIKTKTDDGRMIPVHNVSSIALYRLAEYINSIARATGRGMPRVDGITPAEASAIENEFTARASAGDTPELRLTAIQDLARAALVLRIKDLYLLCLRMTVAIGKSVFDH